jgi:hypothetical protein
MNEQAKQARAREIQEAIAHVLLHTWDPIGVKDEPQAQDEYDSYVGGVYRLLASGATPQEVAEHLCLVETESMGLTQARPSDLLPVAEKLCSLDVRLEKK